MKSLPKKLAYLLLMSLITISPKFAHADDASDKADADAETKYQVLKGSLTTFSSFDVIKKEGFDFSLSGPVGAKFGSESDAGDCPTKFILKVDGPFATLDVGGTQKIIITQDNLQLPEHLKDLEASDSQMFYFAKDAKGRLVMLNNTGALLFTFAADSVLIQGSGDLSLKTKAGGCILNKDAPAQSQANKCVVESSKVVKEQLLQGAADMAKAPLVTGGADMNAPAK